MTDRLLLLLAGFGLVPVALSYGVVPSATVTHLLGFPVEGVNLTHVFRAVMGIYLANALFWLAGAMNPALRRPALWALFVFMAGVAGGRVLSILIDGMPSSILVMYLLVELVFATLAAVCLRRAA